MIRSIAIAGIHTGIGKTIAAAVITEALGADYWKPVQAGAEERDAETVKRLITNGAERVHPEAHLLTQPLSPHAAAAIDGVEIDYKSFAWPGAGKQLIVETAGGVLSPMSATTTMADFVGYYQMPVLLVVQHYLGSINHTLMSIEVLRQRGISILGLVINGDASEPSESFIISYTGLPIIARIPQFARLAPEGILSAANAVRPSLAAVIGQ